MILDLSNPTTPTDQPDQTSSNDNSFKSSTPIVLNSDGETDQPSSHPLPSQPVSDNPPQDQQQQNQAQAPAHDANISSGTDSLDYLKPASADDFEEKKDNNKVFPKVLMVIGPLFLAGSLAFAIFNLNSKAQPASSYPVETVDSGIEIKNNDDYHKYAPGNPTQVKAYADKTKKQELTSGQAYSFDNPYFEWSGAKTNEPKTKITGYFVTFDDKQHSHLNPSESMIFTTSNHYSPKDHSLNLEKGKKYKLFVQSATNGKARLGIDRKAKKSATAIFEYVYQ